MPGDVVFTTEDEPSLLPILPSHGSEPKAFSVPRAYAELLTDAVCHRAADRFGILYRVLWRITQGDRKLVARASDADVARLNEYASNVRRDIHKTHAFLRFRPRQVEGRTLHGAWFEPQHYTLRRSAPFFVDRFANMDWLIATPIGTAAWSEGRLAFGPPISRPAEANDVVLDELWLTYYRTTFNPARVRTKSMVNEMPRHYWRNMPEASLIPEMVASANGRVADMNGRVPDRPPLFARKIAARLRPQAPAPEIPLERLRAKAVGCTRCPLFGPATQTVFGDGPPEAKVMFVGEQPGDQEDLVGRPFVGPAGQLFDRAAAEAGISRDTAYITNAVKHFKYEPRGKRRIHSKPNADEVTACRWWLERELAVVKPRLVVALGATAALALAGRAVSVTRQRGMMAFGSYRGFVTVHPSFLLRLPREDVEVQYEAFVKDLRAVRALIAQPRNDRNALGC
ncbi:UdgX family uracil-DNA binding protein [Bradyrhizobium sp. USDA 10063]